MNDIFDNFGTKITSAYELAKRFGNSELSLQIAELQIELTDLKSVYADLKNQSADLKQVISYLRSTMPVYD